MNFAISTIVGFSDFPLKLGLYAGAVSFLAAVIFAISALCGFREYKVILAAVNVLFAVLFLLVGIMGEYFSVAFEKPSDLYCGKGNQFRALRMIQIIKQLYFRYKELINYVIVGGLTTVVSLASYYFFTAVFLNPQDPFQLMTANTLSWICAVSFAYITNRKFVFESKSADKLREMLKFFSARISTLLIEMACMTLLVNILHWNDRISKFAVQFIVMALNYIFSKLFVFRIKE
jgi:putative flippase GtrA